MRCWAFFCDLTGRPRFPPMEGAASAWSSVFGAGRSPKIYVAHPEKARPLMGVPTSWKSKAVQTAVFGMARAGDRSQNPRPAATKDQLIHLILPNGWRNEPFVIDLLSWTCLLRFPSECLPLRRQRRGEGLSSDERLERQAVVGLSEGQVIISLNRRKHMGRGSRLIRVRLCEECEQEA